MSLNKNTLLFVLLALAAVAAWFLFDKSAGAILGAGASLVGVRSRKQAIQASKAKAMESDQREEQQVEQAQDFKQDADAAHAAAQQATQQKTEDKEGEALENAFSHRRR